MPEFDVEFGESSIVNSDLIDHKYCSTRFIITRPHLISLSPMDLSFWIGSCVFGIQVLSLTWGKLSFDPSGKHLSEARLEQSGERVGPGTSTTARRNLGKQETFDCPLSLSFGSLSPIR